MHDPILERLSALNAKLNTNAQAGRLTLADERDLLETARHAQLAKLRYQTILAHDRVRCYEPSLFPTGRPGSVDAEWLDEVEEMVQHDGQPATQTAATIRRLVEEVRLSHAVWLRA
jgi:hypothetical protein